MRSVVLWTIDLLTDDNKRGILELETLESEEAAFFPINVSFTPLAPLYEVWTLSCVVLKGDWIFFFLLLVVWNITYTR